MDPSWLQGQTRVIPAVSLLRSHLNPWNFKELLDLLMYNTWEWEDPWMVRVGPEEDTEQLCAQCSGKNQKCASPARGVTWEHSEE